MFELILENKNGDQLTFGLGSPFQIAGIDGLSAPKATINTSQTALMDGGKFNSSKVQMRTMHIAIAIDYDAAKSRTLLYRVIKSKQYIKVIYNGQYRKVFIEGYVEDMPITHTDMKQICTVTIVCPEPFFKEAQMAVTEMRDIVSNFHFPFYSTAEPQIVFSYISNEAGMSVRNGGDVECGMIIELSARGAVSNPKVYDYITQQFIGVEFDMIAADMIRIDTRRGKKSAVLVRNGAETSVFNKVMPGSTWLQLPAEGSTFVYEVGTGSIANLNVTFGHYNLYEGV